MNNRRTPHVPPDMQAQLTLNTPQTPKHEAPGPRAEFVDASAAAPFLVGGDAVVTFESRKTGVRFTYQIRLAEPRQGDDREPPHFVSVLTGPNNSADYVYLGCIFSKKVYSHGKNSKIDRSAPSAVAFAWAWRHLSAGKMPEGLAVWHEGRCARCGRRLSTPRSIATGFGPVCEGKARL